MDLFDIGKDLEKIRMKKKLETIKSMEETKFEKLKKKILAKRYSYGCKKVEELESELSKKQMKELDEILESMLRIERAISES